VRARRHYPRPVLEVSDHCVEIDGQPVFWRSAPPASGDGQAGAVPLYLHGVPGSCDDWIAPRAHRAVRPRWRRWWRRRRAGDEWVQPPPYQTGFLERSGGLAVDLPGFGRSGKPGYLTYTIAEYERFIERFLAELAIERVALAMHDWGAVGLAFAQRHPERVQRLALINAVALSPGVRWGGVARIWRTPALGELAMGCTGRSVLRRASERYNAARGPLPEGWLDSVLEHFDQGTQRAILRLYRSASAEELERAGAHLGRLQMPALVVWGAQDPCVSERSAREYVDVLADSRLIALPDAGHWPWLDRPDVIDTLCAFLTDGAV
jgi:pimeloyl-ACP methyl ester carboxylesterase